MHRLRNIVFASALLFAPLGAFAAAPGDLVKLPCPGGEHSNDPCRAVYFYGGDGRRHAFPNEGNYFTWYKNFDTVKTIAPESMAAIPLGDNVTYRPGIRLVKFPSEGKVYAVGADRTLHWVTTEQVALSLAGQDWAKRVDDIPDTFFNDYVFGAAISDPGSFNATAEKDAAPNIDAALPESYRTQHLVTTRGAFDVQVIRLRKNRVSMITDVAAPPNCTDGCATKSLGDYAAANGALIGVHGSYFCPPEYADCQGKTNTFLPPFFRTSDRTTYNSFSWQVHKGPLLAYFSNGQYVFLKRATDAGGSSAAFESQRGALLVAAASNYPALMAGGEVIVDSEPLLDDGQRNNKATRAGIGMDDDHLIIAVTKNATVPDLAAVFAALGAKDALNLDGGGSTAMFYGGAYKIGPGRTLPNAILFKAK